MNKTEKTFSLEDMDDAFWEKVLVVKIHPSSGLYGVGDIWMFTENHEEFWADFNQLGIGGWWELDTISHLFERIVENDEKKYHAENEGWMWIKRDWLLVRDSFLDRFMEVYQVEVKKEINSVGCVNIKGMVGRAMGEKKGWVRYAYNA